MLARHDALAPYIEMIGADPAAIDRERLAYEQERDAPRAGRRGARSTR
jgi:hypothetical protein